MRAMWLELDPFAGQNRAARTLSAQVPRRMFSHDTRGGSSPEHPRIICEAFAPFTRDSTHRIRPARRSGREFPAD